MRDAVRLDAIRFHIDPASISFTNAILEGVQKEIDSHKSGTGLLSGGLSSMVGPERSRRGRGRGRGTSTGTRSSSTQRSTSRGGPPST